jgi:hypothetical protein
MLLRVIFLLMDSCSAKAFRKLVIFWAALDTDNLLTPHSQCGCEGFAWRKQAVGVLLLRRRNTYDPGQRLPESRERSHRRPNAAVTFVDMNALKIVAPSLSPGAQRIFISNPDGESVSLDAAFIANSKFDGPLSGTGVL